MPYNAGKKGKLNQPASTANSKSAQGHYGVKDTFLYGKQFEYPGFSAPGGTITRAGVTYQKGGTESFAVASSGFSTFSVANSAITVDIKLFGGGGGSRATGNLNAGAAGGLTSARVSLPVGDYAILVGAGGHAGVGGGGASGSSLGSRVFPDGGAGGFNNRGDGGCGGGGSTRLGLLTHNGVTLADSSAFDGTASFNTSTYGGYIAIAGGGAGSSMLQNLTSTTTDPDFGVGGGTLGGNGSNHYSTNGTSTGGDGIVACGHGGTQVTGGAKGEAGRSTGATVSNNGTNDGTDGAKYLGGDGAAGGGGGYFGGGGAAVYYAQAGGGSGYLDNTYVVAGVTSETTINGGTSVSTYFTPQTASTDNSDAGKGGENAAGGTGLFRLDIV